MILLIPLVYAPVITTWSEFVLSGSVSTSTMTLSAAPRPSVLGIWSVRGKQKSTFFRRSIPGGANAAAWDITSKREGFSRE